LIAKKTIAQFHLAIRPAALHYRVDDQTKLFGLSWLLDQIFGLIFGLRPNSYLGSKIRRHLHSLCKISYVWDQTFVWSFLSCHPLF